MGRAESTARVGWSPAPALATPLHSPEAVKEGLARARFTRAASLTRDLWLRHLHHRSRNRPPLLSSRWRSLPNLTLFTRKKPGGFTFKARSSCEWCSGHPGRSRFWASARGLAMAWTRRQFAPHKRFNSSRRVAMVSPQTPRPPCKLCFSWRIRLVRGKRCPEQSSSRCSYYFLRRLYTARRGKPTRRKQLP